LHKTLFIICECCYRE